MAFGGELATVSVLRAVRVVEGGGGDVSGFGCAWGLPGGGSALSGKIGDRTTWVRGVPLDEIGERTTRGRTSKNQRTHRILRYTFSVSLETLTAFG